MRRRADPQFAEALAASDSANFHLIRLAAAIADAEDARLSQVFVDYLDAVEEKEDAFGTLMKP